MVSTDMHVQQQHREGLKGTSTVVCLFVNALVFVSFPPAGTLVRGAIDGPSASSQPKGSHVAGPCVSASQINPNGVHGNHKNGDSSHLPWWAEIPAVQPGLEYPHRWKEFLPSAGVAPKRSEKAKPRIKSIDHFRQTARAVRGTRSEGSELTFTGGNSSAARVSYPGIHFSRIGEKCSPIGHIEGSDGLDEAEDDEYGDDDEEEDDDGQHTATVDRDAKTKHDRLVLAHLKKQARREALAACRSAKWAAKIVNPADSSVVGGRNASFTVSQGGHAIFSLMKTLWLLVGQAILHSARLGLALARYSCYVSRLVTTTGLSTIRAIGRGLSTVWPTFKYIIGQVFRPIRVLLAPIVYLWLGVKWTFWDLPSYSIFLALREIYPLYVFCGTGLALGSGIGIVCALLLWVGALTFRSTSRLEAHLKSWRSSETSEINRRLNFERKNGKTLWALAQTASENEQARAAESNRWANVKGRAVGRRSGMLRSRRSVEDGGDISRHYYQQLSGQSCADRDVARGEAPFGDVADEDRQPMPDYLRSLGKEWRPLTQVSPASAALQPQSQLPSLSPSGSGASSSNGIEVLSRERLWFGTSASSTASAEGGKYFSMEPQQREQQSRQGTRGEGAGRGGAVSLPSPLEGPVSPTTFSSLYYPVGSPGQRFRSVRTLDLSNSGTGSSSSSTGLRSPETMRRRRGVAGTIIG